MAFLCSPSGVQYWVRTGNWPPSCARDSQMSLLWGQRGGGLSRAMWHTDGASSLWRETAAWGKEVCLPSDTLAHTWFTSSQDEPWRRAPSLQDTPNPPWGSLSVGNAGVWLLALHWSNTPSAGWDFIPSQLLPQFPHHRAPCPACLQGLSSKLHRQLLNPYAWELQFPFSFLFFFSFLSFSFLFSFPL